MALGVLFYEDDQVMVEGEEGGGVGHKPLFYIVWKNEYFGTTKIIIDILTIIFGGNGLLHAFNLWQRKNHSFVLQHHIAKVPSFIRNKVC